MYKKYKLKKKAWSLSARYTVTDEMDNLCYESKGYAFKLHKVAELFDSFGQYVCTIRSKIFSFKSTYFIDKGDVPTYRFVKSIGRLKDQIFVDSLTEADAFVIQGNFWSSEYKFIQDGCEFAYVSKEMWSFKDMYGIAVEEGYDASIVIACVIIINTIKEKQRAAAAG